MSSKEIIARLTKGGKKFEIILDQHKFQEYKEGKISEIDEVVIGDGIFSDLQKAQRSDESILMSTFGTTDFVKISKEIIEKGEVQITTEERRKMIEEKRKRLIDLFSKRVIDPRTGKPYPPTRIENAFDEVRVKIDAFEPVEVQFKQILDELKGKIPISTENTKMEFKILAKYYGSAKQIIDFAGKILKENWYGEYWYVTVEFPKAMTDELLSKLNSLTHGELISNIVES